MKRFAVLLFTAAVLAAVLLPLARAPRAGARPIESHPAQGSDFIPSACTAAITETASPDSLRLCEASDVSVTAAVTCPARLPVHMVIVIDRSKSMADTSQPVSNRISQDVKRAARNAIDALDWDIPGTMVGVVSHGFRITTQTDLTESKSRAIGAVNAVRYDPGDVGEDPGKAIERAQLLLERERETTSPLEVIVAFGDGCDPTVTGCEVSSRRAAAEAAGVGINVMPVCYPESDRSDCPDYRALASETRYYFEGGNRVPRAVEQIQESGDNVQVSSIKMLEALTSGVTYAPDSGAPAPDIDDARLTFEFGETAPGQAVTATYQVSVTAVGQTPIRMGASALTLIDSLDRPSLPIPIPMRSITVTGPCINATATPTMPPTATTVPTQPATETPVATPTSEETPTPRPTDVPTVAPPTATPETRSVFLPLLLKDACKPSELHTNVVLVIDASTSMDQAAGEDTKLDLAQIAALTFVELLDLGQDVAGIVSFNENAQLRATLTGDLTALHSAIEGIASEPGTRIDKALSVAAAELASDRALPGNNNVLILLTDGRPNEGTAGLVIDAATSTKAAGTIVYAIGLGADVDTALLEQVATSEDTYIEAPDASDLERIYREIAGALPCPGGAFWGGQ